MDVIPQKYRGASMYYFGLVLQNTIFLLVHTFQNDVKIRASHTVLSYMGLTTA